MSEPEEARDEQPEEEAEEPKTVIDEVADLLQMASDWVRQEARDIVRTKVVLPLQRLGLTLASAQAAGCLLVIGLIFIEVAGVMFLGNWLGYDWAFLIIGGTAVVGSAIFLAIKIRLVQK